jgi:hypothetical protein
MLDNTRLAAIQFTRYNVTHIRVYYQDENFIKESCYDGVNKWYTRNDSIIASDVKINSPIAATSWADGKEVSMFMRAYLYRSLSIRSACTTST